MFNNACFFLFCGYIARYAPLKKLTNILFLLYKKLGDIILNSFLFALDCSNARENLTLDSLKKSTTTC